MPASAEPTGAPRPFEKQIDTVSKCWHHSARSDPAGHDGVHQAGAVQVHGQVVLVRPPRDLTDALERVNPAAAAVVGVLQADQPRAHVMGVVRGADRAGDVFEAEDAAVALEGPRGHAREPSDSAGFPDVDVRGRRAEQLVARLRVDADADLVGHRPGRNEHRRFLAEQLGGPGLETR